MLKKIKVAKKFTQKKTEHAVTTCHGVRACKIGGLL